MDQPTIETKRDSVPDWARPKTGEEASAVGGERKITGPQRSYLLGLIARKHTPKAEAEGKIDLIMKCLRTSEDPEEFGMSMSKASELIDWFNKQPDKPKEQQEPANDQAERFAVGVPAGRYAIENDEGLLRFYNVWVSRDKKRLNVYVLHGPDESDLKFHKTVVGVLKKIKAAGVRECAIRYGLEIGSCSNCGRRLTNHISRALGIGPVCGGRMFGQDEWRDEVKAKRQELIDAGIDPDEEIDD